MAELNDRPQEHGAPDVPGALRIDGGTHHDAPTLPTGLIGRAKECGALDELLAAVRGGRSQVLVVQGEPGIGKSALLQHLVHAASDFRVIQATGIESEMEVPFSALHLLFGSLLDQLATLPGPQHDAASTVFGLGSHRSPDRLLIGLACLNLLSTAADERPLLCVVDDTHWLDTPSTQALTFVARRLLADRVALVFATRAPSADLAQFPQLRVERLPVGDARILLNTILGAPLDERVRERIIAETRGNPLALVEWPRGLTRAGLAGGFGMSSLAPMTGQIEESFRRRILQLPELAQQFLTLAAAEPTGDPRVVWRAAVSLGIGRRDAAFAVEAGLIDIGIRVTFRHPLVRAAAYRSTSLDGRQAAHRALGQATDAGLDPDRQAWHLALGAPGPDESIAQALEQSARRAQRRGGIAAAAALRERSISLTGESPRRVHRMLAAAAAHAAAGSYDHAAHLLASIEPRLLDDSGRARLELLRARLASSVGNYRDVPAMFLRAARLFEPIDAMRAGISYLDALGSATAAGTFCRGTTIVGVARAARACGAAEEPTTQGRLIAGLASATLDGPATAAPMLRLALDSSAEELTNPTGLARLGGLLDAAASTLWDIDALHRLAELQVARGRELGAMQILPWALHTFAHVLTLEGKLDEASSLLAESRRIIEETGAVMLPWATPTVAAWRGADASLGAIEDLVRSAVKAEQAQALRSAQWANAILCNGLGLHEAALAAAIEAGKQPWEWGSQFHFAELIEAAVRCDEPTIAATALERLAASVEATGSDWGLGLHLRSQALLRSGSMAEDCYVEAIEHLARTPIRPELARAHLLYGEWLRRESRKIDARAQLRTAHQMFTSLGIRAFAERARGELSATGESVRKRSVENYAELTAQEANIARLASEGHTNPEIGAQLFISARTVEWHLRNVFNKLNVGSRKELRTAMTRSFPPAN